MRNRGNKEFIIDMFLSCQKILEYTKGMEFDDFVQDTKTIDAVVRNIEILGEAVKNISKDFKEKYIEVDWDIIARTRDRIIHFYFGIDVSIIWKITKMDISPLLEKLRTIIKNEGWIDEFNT